MSKAPEDVSSEAFTVILIRSIPRGGGSLLLSEILFDGNVGDVSGLTRLIDPAAGCCLADVHEVSHCLVYVLSLIHI